MTLERAQEIERLYHEARERDPSHRSTFLERECAGDESLRAEVESLLAWREQAAGFLEASDPDPATTSAKGREGATATASTPGRRGFFRRWPWLVWAWTLPVCVAAGGLCWVLFTGPAPIEWTLVSDSASWGRLQVQSVRPEGAAARAGLQAADLVRAADIEGFVSRRDVYAPHPLEVVRRGEQKRLILTAERKDLRYWLGRAGGRRLLLAANAALCLALAGLLLFRRPRDRGARWGALLLTQLGFVMLMRALRLTQFSPEVAHQIRVLPVPVGIVALLGLSFCAMIPAGAFGFAAVFPRPLPLGKRLWWLFLLAPAVTILPDLKWFWLPVYAGVPPGTTAGLLELVGFPLGTVFLGGALTLLACNYLKLESLTERRRLRIAALGFGFTFFALTMTMGTWTLALLRDEPLRDWLQSSAWRFVDAFLVAAAPICMTYAILRHRVFDIHVIVRLGLRYAAARGVLLSVVPAVALVLALDVLMHRNQAVREIAAERGLVYLALVGGALALHLKRTSWMDAIDRRFFRERYDAYRLLAGVADDVRRSGSFDEAARHMIARIDEALHPESASLMISKPGDPGFHCTVSIGNPPPPIPASARLVGLARVLGKPLENAQVGAGWLQQQLPRVEVEFLRRARVEWLFPVSLRETGTQAFLLLGPKRSEEPYSREDRDLLGAVTASLGLLVEHQGSAGFTECSTCGTCYELGSAHCPNDDGALVKSPYPRAIAGRYRFDRRLGRGGMGVVYEAFDTQLKRQVAVKVIRPDLMASPEAAARFRREARTAAGLSHPSVVNVYDFGVADDGRTYLVMELLQGRSLREELHERRRLDSETALKILRSVSGAVALAHANGLLHRDLKPENIFLAKSEHGQVAKILDFGLVKPLNPGATDTVASTMPGAPLGTPAYMSPEQRRGEAPAEIWDLWALAVVAFEMLTGVHPFAHSGESRKLAVGCSPDPYFDVAALTPSARAFFERAFALECSRRPTSVRQFIDELEKAIAGQ